MQLKTLPTMQLAYMRYTGPYGQPDIAQLWVRFGAWCQQQGLMQPRRLMLGISLDNPMTTAPQACRYDCAVQVDASFQPQGDVALKSFAGGDHVCAPFKGAATSMGAAWLGFFGPPLFAWLAEQGLRLTGETAVELYDTDFEFDQATGVFNCWLCAPVTKA